MFGRWEIRQPGELEAQQVSNNDSHELARTLTQVFRNSLGEHVRRVINLLWASHWHGAFLSVPRVPTSLLGIKLPCYLPLCASHA